MAKQETKKAIIREGAQLIHSKGFNNTGIQEILQAVGVPKGSFYFYFKNKEDFGLQIVDYFEQTMLRVAETYLTDRDLPPLMRMKNFFNAYRTHFEKTGCRQGCPIGNLTQEMSDLSEVFRKRIASIYRRITTNIETCIRDAQVRGDIALTLNSKDVADFILDSWEGAVMRMKLDKTTRPLALFEKYLFDTLLASYPGNAGHTGTY